MPKISVIVPVYNVEKYIEKMFEFSNKSNTRRNRNYYCK